jgi:hypothetical protein
VCHLDDTRPNDIRAISGSWRVWPIVYKECLVEYDLYIDSGFHAPKVIEHLIGDYGLGKVVTSMKRRIESQGTFKK